MLPNISYLMVKLFKRSLARERTLILLTRWLDITLSFPFSFHLYFSLSFSLVRYIFIVILRTLSTFPSLYPVLLYFVFYAR